MSTTLAKLYRFLVPESVRRHLRPVTASITSLLFPNYAHQSTYDDEYYSMVEEWAAPSMPVIAASVLRDLSPKTVIDVGCGTGALLAVFKREGCRVRGLEYSDAALAYCRSRGLDVLRFDIERDTLCSGESCDVAISLEVAEHLPASKADKFVAMLASLSDQIILTAATPGQGGRDHVNEQPRSYWIGKFANQGYSYDEKLTVKWRDEWKQSNAVANWYYNNLMAFHRSGGGSEQRRT